MTSKMFVSATVSKGSAVEVVRKKFHTAQNI
jgi:hypothetical protein